MESLPLLRVIAALLMTITLLLAAAWLARRSGFLNPLKRHSRITILESQRLGTRHHICLVRVDDTEMLLAITSQQVTLLHKGNVAS